jgi:hypothetical protein
MGRGGVGWWIIGLLVLWLACTGCQQREETPTKQDLTYMAGGKDLSPTAWEPELPADIVMVIDQSGSMSKGKDPTDPMGLRVKGSLAFLEFVAGRSRPNLPNRFGVVSFGTEAPLKHTVPLTPITSVEDPAVKRIGAQLIPLDLGDTSFISALRRAIQLLRESVPRRR